MRGVSRVYERLYEETWDPPQPNSLFGDDQRSKPPPLVPTIYSPEVRAALSADDNPVNGFPGTDVVGCRP
jgi:hypothetical protein